MSEMARTRDEPPEKKNYKFFSWGGGGGVTGYSWCDMD